MEENQRSVSTFPANGSEGKLSKTASSIHGTVDKVAAKTNEAVAGITPAIGRATDAAHQVVDKVTNVAVPAAEWISNQGQMLATKGRSAEADARAFVSAHPWQSIGAALAVGYLVGRRHLHRQ